MGAAESSVHALTPGDARARVEAAATVLALEIWKYHRRETGPHALEQAAFAAVADLRTILITWPQGGETAGLYTAQGRILAELEAVKGRLTAQDDRITGIATDLQGLEIDVREGRRGDGAV